MNLLIAWCLCTNCWAISVITIRKYQLKWKKKISYEGLGKHVLDYDSMNFEVTYTYSLSHLHMFT